MALRLKVIGQNGGGVVHNGTLYRPGEEFDATEAERWTVERGICEEVAAPPAPPETELVAESASTAATVEVATPAKPARVGRRRG